MIFYENPISPRWHTQLLWKLRRLLGLRLHIAKGMCLERSDFNHATMGNLHEVVLEGANLTGVNLSEASIEKVVFMNATLVGANFSDSPVHSADFEGANLQDANFTGAKLADCDFFNANLCGTNFGGAELGLNWRKHENGAFGAFVGCTYDQRTIWHKADPGFQGATRVDDSKNATPVQTPVSVTPTTPQELAAHFTAGLDIIIARQPGFEEMEATIQQWGVKVAAKGKQFQKSVITEVSRRSDGYEREKELARIWRVEVWSSASGRTMYVRCPPPA